MSRRPPRTSLQELGPVQRRTGPRRRTRQQSRSALLPLAIIFAVLAAVAGGVVYALHHSNGPSLSDQRAPASQAVVFLLDGVPASVLHDRSLPHLRQLADGGRIYTQAWAGQMENTPLASAATIGTGAFPAHSGVVGDQWSASGDHVTRPNDPQSALLGGLDQIMEGQHTVPLAASIKDRKPHAVILSIGGSDCAEASAAGTWLADYVLCFARDGRRWVPQGVAGHTLPSGAVSSTALGAPAPTGKGVGPALEGWFLGAQTNQIASYTRAAMDLTKPTLTIVDLPEYGLVVPFVGPNKRNAVARRILAAEDAAIGRLVSHIRKKAGGGKTAFVVATTSPSPEAVSRLPLSKLVDAIIAGGGQQGYVEGGGSAVIGLQPLQAQPVAQSVESERLSQIDGIYYKVQGSKGWTYQSQFVNPLLPSGFSDAMRYFWGTLGSAVSPDVIVVSSPGVAFSAGSPGPSGTREVVPGVQWESQHIGLLFSGHGVRSGSSRYPARLADIAPTVAALLGLTQQHADGIVLADALEVPSDADKSRQSDTGAKLTPLMQALQRRAASP